MRAIPVIAVALTLLTLPACAQAPTAQLDRIKLPAGFKIDIFAQVPEARSMAVVPALNAVFVGNRRGDKVYVAIDADRDGKAEEVKTVASGLKSPNGIAWKDDTKSVMPTRRKSHASFGGRPYIDASVGAAVKASRATTSMIASWSVKTARYSCVVGSSGRRIKLACRPAPPQVPRKPKTKSMMPRTPISLGPSMRARSA